MFSDFLFIQILLLVWFPFGNSLSASSSSGRSSSLNNDYWDSDDDYHLTPKINAWPNGVIPYEIGSDISDSNARTLRAMLSDLSRETCVQFVPHRSEANYTLFKSGSKCSAPLGVSNNPVPSRSSSLSGGSSSSSGSSSGFGRSSSSSSLSSSSRYSTVSGASQVILASSCFETKRLARRIMNLLGIPHETSRPDRDQYVTINLSNIRSGYTANLEQVPRSAYLPGVLDVPYDYQSVTQYNDSDLAKDPKTWAIKSKSSRSSSQTLGGDDFSSADIQKIQRAYGCRTTRSGG